MGPFHPFNRIRGVSLPGYKAPHLVMLYPRVPENRLNQKDSADSGVQFITLAGPRQSFLLAKDPNQFL